MSRSSSVNGLFLSSMSFIYLNWISYSADKFGVIGVTPEPGVIPGVYDIKGVEPPTWPQLLIKELLPPVGVSPILVGVSPIVPNLLGVSPNLPGVF